MYTKKDLLLTSPIPGPPNTRISSLDEPPLSLIGMILPPHQHAHFKKNSLPETGTY